MKRITLIAIAIIAVGLTSSCRDSETKTVVKEVRVETKEVEKERDGILERAAKEVDKEINEEINEEIDKIGNDD